MQLLFSKQGLTILNDAVAWGIDGLSGPGTCVDLDPCVVDNSLREMSRPHERSLDMGTLSREQLHAELEKGYADIAAGRTKLAGEVFTSIRKDY